MSFSRPLLGFCSADDLDKPRDVEVENDCHERVMGDRARKLGTVDWGYLRRMVRATAREVAPAGSILFLRLQIAGCYVELERSFMGNSLVV